MFTIIVCAVTELQQRFSVIPPNHDLLVILRPNLWEGKIEKGIQKYNKLFLLFKEIIFKVCYSWKRIFHMQFNIINITASVKKWIRISQNIGRLKNLVQVTYNSTKRILCTYALWLKILLLIFLFLWQNILIRAIYKRSHFIGCYSTIFSLCKRNK